MMKDLAIIAVTMIVLDIAWITLFMSKIFTPMIEKIQGKPMVLRPLGGFLAYAAMIGLFFTFKDNLTPLKAFLLGVGVFMTYDFTSYALFSDWDLKTALIDTTWGGVLFLLAKIVYDMIKS
ncbi:putative membrane protein (DUF2177) [Acanthocystis turfacea Chlorella virus OR0704.3]|nr:putative membrane protein (DUF2177) [Acanthocystis turfacea Chlorella virus OR0704.3]